MSVASVVLIIESLQKIIVYVGEISPEGPIMGTVTISIACLTIGELISGSNFTEFSPKFDTYIIIHLTFHIRCIWFHITEWRALNW